MRLHESTLFEPITWRTNFCARKFISFVAFEQENIPNDERASASRARNNPSAARSSASPQEVGINSPSVRTSGTVNLVLERIPRSPSPSVTESQHGAILTIDP